MWTTICGTLRTVIPWRARLLVRKTTSGSPRRTRGSATSLSGAVARRPPRTAIRYPPWTSSLGTVGTCAMRRRSSAWTTAQETTSGRKGRDRYPDKERNRPSRIVQGRRTITRYRPQAGIIRAIDPDFRCGSPPVHCTSKDRAETPTRPCGPLSKSRRQGAISVQNLPLLPSARQPMSCHPALNKISSRSQRMPRTIPCSPDGA